MILNWLFIFFLQVYGNARNKIFKISGHFDIIVAASQNKALIKKKKQTIPTSLVKG